MSGGCTDKSLFLHKLPVPSQAANHQMHLLLGNPFITFSLSVDQNQLGTHASLVLILLMQMGQVQAQLQGQQSQAAALQQALRAAQAQHAQVQLSPGCKVSPSQ